MNKSIHIVSFDVPYPPNYGGIVDVFYKLKALHKLGIKITFHCFYYEGNNAPNKKLESFCETIYYYKRKKHLGKLLLSKYPFIVASRNNDELLSNLLKNENPIFFEGIQTCFFLDHPKLNHRTKIVRANNIEHKYYKGLAKSETNSLKKLYLKWEAKKLKQYESILKKANYIFSVAKMDVAHFSKYAPTYHIPPFFNTINKSKHIPYTAEKYILYQGNLSVSENSNAVNYIISKIAPFIDFQIVIAGKDPSIELQNKINQAKNVRLISNPSQKKMNHLIENAHINLLLTFQQTGIKLKLLHALEIGQHIIINKFMDDEGIFKQMCEVADTPNEIINSIERLMQTEFSESFYSERQRKFKIYFDNTKNAQKMIEIITT
jgi:hypothetical protein